MMFYYLHFQALRLPSHHHRFRSTLAIPLYSLLSSSLTCCPHVSTYSSSANSVQKNPVIFNYLVNTINFSKTNALIVSECFRHSKSTLEIKRAVCFLRSFGISDEQIVSSVLSYPRILTLSIEKNLRPKLMFLQELGLSAGYLGEFVSKRPSFLSHSLENKWKPCVVVIKEVLGNGDSPRTDKNCNEDMLFILSKCSWLVPSVSRFSSNISHLKSVGISGTDLSSLLKREPRILIMNEAKLRRNISEVLDMGFVIGSRMFLKALRARCRTSDVSYSRKFEFFQSFGISRNEVLEMFRKAPSIMSSSEANLRSAIEFFLCFLDKSILVCRPIILLYSMEKRVMPRYRVLKVMKSKGVLKKEPKFITVLQLSEATFWQNYVSRFENDEELLMAFKGPVLDIPKEEEYE